MKRRGVSALQIPTVDILSRAQRLQAERERIKSGPDRQRKADARCWSGHVEIVENQRRRLPAAHRN